MLELQLSMSALLTVHEERAGQCRQVKQKQQLTRVDNVHCTVQRCCVQRKQIAQVRRLVQSNGMVQSTQG